MKKIILIIVLFTLSFYSFIPYINAEDDEKDNINITKNATSAVLIDYGTGQILYNKEANKIHSVASLTKMMGLIIIFENIEKGGIKTDEIITVSKTAKEMGGSQIWLEEGEQISINDLIKGIVMASANDAMVAMAERVSGTEEAFVKQMNEKVKELGLKNTNFVNCTGLDEENNYSTAYDIALIAKELIKHEKILEYTGKYEDYIRESSENKTWLSNTNKLVKFYDGADGLKTGFTDNAGSCMAVTAKRNDLRLIAITLGYKESKDRNQETMNLLDYGFNQYKARNLFKKGDVVAENKLSNTDQKIIYITNEDVSILQKKTDQDKKYNYEIKEETIKIPTKKGTRIGTLYVKENDEIKLKIPLYNKEDINKQNFFKLFISTIKDILYSNS